MESDRRVDSRIRASRIVGITVVIDIARISRVAAINSRQPPVGTAHSQQITYFINLLDFFQLFKVVVSLFKSSIIIDKSFILTESIHFSIRNILFCN